MKFKKYLPIILFIPIVLFLYYKSGDKDDRMTVFSNNETIQFNPHNFQSLFHNNNIFQPHEKYIVNIFASWCSSCGETHLELMRLRKSNVKILGLVWQDSKENIFKMLHKNGNPYYDLGILDEKTIIDLGISGVPTTLIMNQDNKILYKITGSLKAGDLKDAF